MTRPGIVRADTIDLQDPDSPSAQDHTKKHIQPGSNGYAAPHQAAELRHVQDERQSEEVALSNAWNHAHGLSDEPPSEDDDMYHDGERLDGDHLLHQSAGNSRPGEDADSGDDDDQLGDDMERASSSPSITDEDIDFDLVYALHNFVATVEGQANAAKGDTMVLLDDSNSYWWLVRVVKDATIGYLPAEHIETPTERLARLNKHRNIDATKMHFEDSLEKPKNPLKRAILRRNQKNVAFAEPTYRDAPIYDWSSEEEEEEEGDASTNAEANGEQIQAQAQSQNGEEIAQGNENDEITAVAPLSIRGAPQSGQPNGGVDQSQQIQDDEMQIDDDGMANDDPERVGPGRSRNGTVRNTDSFFKDDTVETKKITITPRLLREDNGADPEPRTSESKERSASFDFDKALEKNAREEKAANAGKKKKGMFNIFKRSKGDKKSKDDVNGSAKSSMDMSSESPALTSGTASPSEKLSIDLQRKGSRGKLQKAQPPVIQTAPAVQPYVAQQQQQQQQQPQQQQQQQTQSRGQMSPNGLRPLQLSAEQGLREKASSDSIRAAAAALERTSPDKQEHPRPMSNNPFARAAENSTPSPVMQSNNPFIKTNNMAPLARSPQMLDNRGDGLSESPIHVTAEDAHPEAEPPALVRDTSSVESDDVHFLRDSPSPQVQQLAVQDPHSASQRSPISPTIPTAALGGAAAAAAAFGGVSLLARNQSPIAPSRSPPPHPMGPGSPYSPTSPVTNLSKIADRQNSTSTTTSAILSSGPSTPVWSDASLRQYLDESGSTDIRDLLLITQDTTGVLPVSHNHPLMAGLFSEERGKVREMDDSLNTMLNGWLERKMRSRLTVGQQPKRTT